MPESGIILVVPETEPLVGALRDQYDRVARLGVPAHITLLYPWLTPPIADDAIDRLRNAVTGAASYTMTFRGIGRFEGAMYLRPDDQGQTAALMSRLERAFPECPPYGGRFREQVPHLTVAETADVQGVIDAYAPRLLGALPLTAEASAVTVMQSDENEHWTVRAQIPLVS